MSNQIPRKPSLTDLTRQLQRGEITRRAFILEASTRYGISAAVAVSLANRYAPKEAGQ